MSFSDGSPCPWAGKFHGQKMMDIPTTFLRWIQRECPWQVERHPGMAEYVASRIGAEGCVRSATREARTEGPPRGKTPRQLGIRRERKTQAPPPARVEGSQGDLFALAKAMREAAK